MKKENIKAAFFDVDNTLYDHKHNCVPNLHIKALKELQKNDIKVCLCTGRSLPLIKELHLLDLLQWDGIVSGNGSFVYDKNLNPIYENCISETSTKKIFSLAEQYDIPLFCSGNTLVLTKQAKDSQALLEDFDIRTFDRRSYSNTDCFSLITLCTQRNNPHLAEFEAIDEIKIIPNRSSIDIMKKSLSKYHGIEVLMQHFQYNPHDYIAFGDGLNDIEMLTNAKYGIRMEDGDPALQEKVSMHCPSCQEAGIYYFLKKEGLIE